MLIFSVFLPSMSQFYHFPSLFYNVLCLLMASGLQSFFDFSLTTPSISPHSSVPCNQYIPATLVFVSFHSTHWTFFHVRFCILTLPSVWNDFLLDFHIPFISTLSLRSPFLVFSAIPVISFNAFLVICSYLFCWVTTCHTYWDISSVKPGTTLSRTGSLSWVSCQFSS